MIKSAMLRGLQAFEAVGRCGSVTAAAEELNVSPGAISQQVRKLEEHLDLMLLERKGRKVELTSWGRLYHLEISKGFEQLSFAQDVLSRARSNSTLVLSALSSVMNRWIGRRIFDWQASYPKSNIKLIGKDSEPKLGFEEADFRITYGSKIGEHEHYSELYRDWIVPVCSPSMLDASRPLGSPADIFKYPLLTVEWEKEFTPFPRWGEWARKAQCPYEDIAPGLSFTLSSNAIDAARSGRGFVLAQISMIMEEIATGSLVAPFDIRLQLPESYFLAWDRAALKKPFGTEFRAWILAIAKQQSLQSAPPEADR